MNIASIKARQIIDSRGNPTVEADVILRDGTRGRAAVPSGASTGMHEAHELRDEGDAYLGKGVSRAIKNIHTIIAPALKGMDVSIQRAIDEKLIALDGTENKSKLGANAILAVSLAVAHAAARAQNIPPYVHINALGGKPTIQMPVPLINVVNGGAHAARSTDIQEFMIMPVGAETFSQAMRMAQEVFGHLKRVIAAHGYGTTVGDEGGFAPCVTKGNEEALVLIGEAVEAAGYTVGTDIVYALDVAASELYENDRYTLGTEHKKLTREEMVGWLQKLSEKYPIVSIEDGCAEEDWDGWTSLTKKIGQRVQLVGDDLFVTNTAFLQRGIDQKAGNAILIKVNQIGTLTETIDAVTLAHKARWHAIISHRSGETEDVTIAHIAVGLGTGQIKTGSVSRTDRTAKYNELLRIEEMLGDRATYPGHSFHASQ